MGAVELVVLVMALAGVLAVLLVRPGAARTHVQGIAGAVVTVAVLGAVVWGTVLGRARGSHVQLVAAVPDVGRGAEGYVTSDACRACHPGHHASWHESFHRTMTQPATRETVLGRFDDVWLTNRGRNYHLTRRGGEFFVELVDPDWEHDRIAEGVYANLAPNPPGVVRRVVMTTGSHHMQTYWVPSARDGRLFNLPFVWLNDDRRWVPREDVFLRPPDAGRQFGTWHDNCVECHAVAGEPGRDSATNAFDPRVAELGIACEACHGPADTHVRVNRDPRRRYARRLDGVDAPDPTIVNPRRLPARKSAQICGQCHGMNVFKGDALRAGRRYHAGGDFFDTRIILRMAATRMFPDERGDWPRLERHLARQSPTFLSERFWPDGMVAVSGREHNALVESACFQGETLSCLSCHSMHSPESTDDQLAAQMHTDEACLQCHDGYRDAIQEHTHHPPGSSGSRCMNCHMPHTTYGLLKAIRSHHIDSPTVRSSVDTARPNACNLCHLDRTLRWSADHLTRWYGQPDVVLSEDLSRVAAGVLWLLTGDAQQRAIVAWHFGWDAAQEASGRDWMAPFAGHALADPYACVRYIAGRSLRTLPRFEGFPYDFVAAPETRSAARAEAIRRWERTRRRPAETRGAELLLDADGALDRDELTRLSRLRDDRPVDLRE